MHMPWARAVRQVGASGLPRAATARGEATMADGFSLVVMVIAAVLLAVGTLIIVSTRRSVPHRKMFYMFLFFYGLWWLYILDKLFALVGMPRAWRDGVERVLFVPVVATFVLLYRHRHDPDPDDL